jgi:hypothetical protein
MPVNRGIEHQIETVEPQPAYRLVVTWVTGEKSVIDFANEIRGGGVWASLQDEEKFSRARSAWGGSVLEWPEPFGEDGSPRIDIDADGLWSKGFHQELAPELSRFINQHWQKNRIASRNLA